MLWWLACASERPAPAAPPSDAARRAPPALVVADEGAERLPEDEIEEDLPPEVRSRLAKRGGRAPRALPAGGARPTPFLERPFDGIAAAPQWFNHATSLEEQARGLQLAFTGAWVQGKHYHAAYDYLLPTGTPLYAAADGIVVRAKDAGPARCPKSQPSERSLQIKIFHPDAPDGYDYMTNYMHLSRIDVRPGQTVRAGEPIGQSGNSGCSTAPHLHFSVLRITDPDRMAGYAVDPYGWTGQQPDPKGARGTASLWKPGEAPPLRRHGERGPNGNHPVVINNLLALDALDPLDGEFVQLGHRREGQPTRLKGYTLGNLAGERIPLPDLTLAPGELLRLWSRRRGQGERGSEPEREARELELGRSTQLWNDTGDCALLFDPSGRLVSYMAYGRTENAREECRSAPAPDLD